MAEDIQNVQIDKASVRYALEHDPEFFIQFFLGDELTHDVPEFHPEIFNLMINMEVDKFACAIPRDHAKTTLAKLACVWFFLFTDFRFILYLSNTVSIAIPSVNDIIAFMESDNFKAIFGEIKFKTKQDGKGIYTFWLTLNGVTKFCIIRAFGVGQQVRGINIDNKRPQLAILDDIDAAQVEVTETSYKASKRWFYGPFRKCLDKFKHKMVQIGNLTETQSLIADHCKSEYWHSRVYGCLLSDGSSLWPDAWPLEKLRQDYQEYVQEKMADVWFAEMMNMPTAGGRGVILPEEILYVPHISPGEITWGFITIDLAISEKTWAHETVIAVHGFNPDGGPNGVWQAVDYSGFTGIDPIALFWEVIRLAVKWGIQVVGIEAVAYQASLKFVFQHECLVNGIPVAMDEMPGSVGMSFVQLRAVGHKATRISSWASMIKAQEYALNEGDFVLTQQLLSYRPDRKLNEDDYIDAYAYAQQMINYYLHLIIQAQAPKVKQVNKGSLQLSSF